MATAVGSLRTVADPRGPIQASRVHSGPKRQRPQARPVCVLAPCGMQNSRIRSHFQSCVPFIAQVDPVKALSYFLETVWRAGALVLLLAVTSVVQATDSRALNAVFDGILQEHVKDGYVDYPAIARNPRFNKYIESLADFDAATLSDDNERKAFWINAYNALVIKNIIDGKSPTGVMDHMKFFRSNLKVGGRGIDLNSIDGEVLAKFADPRVHFVLVAAYSSAPKLRAEAYVGEELDQQIDDATRDFINDKRRNRFSAALQTAKLSKIFEQHRAEFGKTDKELLAYVARYVKDEEVAKILQRGAYSIKFMDNDFSINGNSIQTP